MVQSNPSENAKICINMTPPPTPICSKPLSTVHAPRPPILSGGRLKA